MLLTTVKNCKCNCSFNFQIRQLFITPAFHLFIIHKAYLSYKLHQTENDAKTSRTVPAK